MNETSLDPVRFGRVAVLLGGNSAEREVSLMSGQRVLAALRRAGIDASPLDPRDDGLGTLCERRFDRCFVVIHGRGGEDGTMQGFLETLGIPYTGSGVFASAVAMNKLATKRIWRSAGLPTPEWMSLSRGDALPRDAFSRLGPTLAVKPVHEGSTLGLSRVTGPGELESALERAFHYDSKVIVEPWITGRELTGSLLAGTALPLIHIEPSVDFYDYEAKYFSDGTRYHCPSGLLESQENELRALCREAFATIDGRGWGRVDLLLDRNDRPWLLEANTIPGMTEHSLVPMAARAAGLSFESLVATILAQTLMEATHAN